MNMQICLINRLKTKVKNGYCSNQFKKSQNNLKQTWKEIGSLIKRKTKKQTIPTRIIRNGISYENQQDVANQLNHHFINVGPSLADFIENTNVDPILYIKLAPYTFHHWGTGT